MTNIIKRITSKRSSKVKTYEYTGGDTESFSKNVTHVQFHPSVTKVHDEAFKDCSKLKEVVLSDGITKIGNGSFQGCKRLKRVVLNNGLKQIGDDTFSGCLSLDSVTFPSTVTTIGDRAFEYCSSLREVIYMKTGYNLTMTFGWDMVRGCCLERYKVRLDKIIDVGHLKELAKKICEMSSSTIYLRDGYIILPLPQVDQECVNRIGNLMQYYEVKEATTLVELALWKSNIEQAVGLDRGVCRIDLPEPAKDLILQYAYQRIPLYTTTCYPIYIKCPRSVSRTIMSVEPTFTIANVKKRILHNKEVPVEKQQLFFQGELLNDDRTLSDCNIQMDSTILLFVSGD